MPPEDVQKAKQQIEQVIQRNERALRDARLRESRGREVLRRSDSAIAGARKTLRRAGYLK